MEDQNIDTKSLFAPKKGKQATKGQKQIYEGNQETIKFYSIMAGITILIRLGLSFPATTTSWVLCIFAVVVQACGIGGMFHMSKPTISGSSKTVVDGGIDLNMKSGFADYIKDLIITTSICTALSIFSNGFWLIWLWLPAFYVFKIWTSVIAPWIFAPAPEEVPEVAEKKRKKMERKMARAGYR